jgi:hypothetical protein
MRTDTKAKTPRGKTKNGGKSQTKPAPTKADKILALLRRPKGGTIVELSKATEWQEHSVRGFLSGTLKKRKGLDVLSEKDDKGVRRYRIATEPAS